MIQINQFTEICVVMMTTLFSTSSEMTPEERDARTVFCMQLSAKLRPRDLEQFFSAVGTVTRLTFNRMFVSAYPHNFYKLFHRLDSLV